LERVETWTFWLVVKIARLVSFAARLLPRMESGTSKAPRRRSSSQL